MAHGRTGAEATHHSHRWGLPAPSRLSISPDVDSEDAGVLRAGVAVNPQQRGIGETRGSELVEEGHALPGAGNSGEPIGDGRAVLI